MAQRVARIEGVVYSGRVRYATVGGLDRLAEFFLDEVLPTEPRIRELVEGFGLPPLIIQDVLGDLLRRGHASLDLERGEIRPAAPATAESRRTYRESEPVKVWQDLLTGRFLPERMVAKLHWRPAGAEVIPLEWDRQNPPPDFLEAPSTRIAASLNGADRSFLASIDPGWDVDAIVKRERLGPFDIYVPIDQTVISGESGADDVIEYIQAELLPRWVKMAWTRAFRRARGGGRIDEVGLSRAYPAMDAASPGLIDACLLEAHADRWVEKFVHLIQARDISADDVAWEDEQRARSILIERLKDSVGTVVAFGPPSGAAPHVEELWARARSYLLIAAPDWTDDLVARLLDATRPVESRSPYLILVRPPGPGVDPRLLAQQRAPDRRVLAPRASYPIFPTVCIVDGAEARFAAPEVLLSERPVLQVIGWAPSAEVSVALDEGAGGSFACELLDTRALKSGPAKNDRVHAIIDTLNEFAQMIDDAQARLRDCELAREDELTNDSPVGPEKGGGGPTDLFDPAPRRRAEELRSLLGAIAQERPLLVPLHPADLTDLVRELLDRSRDEGPHAGLEIVMSEANNFWETPGVLALLDQALGSRADVHIITCPQRAGSDPAPEVVQTALRMHQHFGQRIAVAASRAAAPPAIVFQAGELALVAIGLPGEHAEGGIYFVVRSLRLAEELRDALAAESISPNTRVLP